MTSGVTCRQTADGPFHCGLCGLEFSTGDQAQLSCAACAGCSLIRCPRCGYQFPSGSGIVRLFRRLARAAGRWT